MPMMIHETSKTVEEYFDTWLKYYKFPNLKATSYDVLERTVEKHIYPTLGEKLMIKVESIEVRKLLNVMQNKGFSYSMRKKYMMLLKPVLSLQSYSMIWKEVRCSASILRLKMR